MAERTMADLRAADYNPRKISEHDRQALERSMREFGDLSGIVYNRVTRQLVGGHQRSDLLKGKESSIHMEEQERNAVGTVATGYVELNGERFSYREVEWTLEQEKLANLAANRIRGEFDSLKLSELVFDLKGNDRIDSTGFTNKELSQMIDSLGTDAEEKFDVEKAIEEATAAGYVPRTVRGDVYSLDGHRVMCGDSLEDEDVSLLMDGSIADLVWTDPPYNVNYQSANSKLGGIENDDMGAEDFQAFLDGVVANLKTYSKDGAVFYLCCGWQSFAPTQAAIGLARLHISEVIIWVKNRSGIRTLEYPHKHEQIVKARNAPEKKKKAKSIIYGWKEGAEHYAREAHNMDYDVWEEDLKASQKYVHPTEKPDWLVMRAIKNSSRVGETVLDLFTGSGSALVAAEKTGRRFRGMELDPRFVDVIVDRWEALTGRKADKAVSGMLPDQEDDAAETESA